MTKPNRKAGNGASPAGGAEPQKPPVEAGAKAVAGLRVTARVEGFRRAGRAWSKTPVEISAAELTKAQLAQIRAEPMLSVEDIAP